VPGFGRLVRDAAVGPVDPLLLEDKSKARVRDPLREREAEGVNDLARRFADYEARPADDDKGLGRYFPVSLAPPIGRLLKLDADQVPAGEEVALITLATGYAMFVSLEATFDREVHLVDRDLDKIWAFWVPNMYTGLLKKLGVHDDFLTPLSDLAYKVLTVELKSRQLMPRLKRTRLRGLAGSYGNAGAILRMAQTDLVTDEQIGRDVLAKISMHWPLDRGS